MVMGVAGGGAFTGQSRTLAGGPADTPSAPAASSSQPVVHTITFHSNGVFTVNEGEGKCGSLFMLFSYSRGSCGMQVRTRKFSGKACWACEMYLHCPKHAVAKFWQRPCSLQLGCISSHMPCEETCINSCIQYAPPGLSKQVLAGPLSLSQPN